MSESSAARSRRLETARAERRQHTLDVQDIGGLPPVANRARRRRTRESFRSYCETYYPDRFYRTWSPAHLEAIRKIEEAVKSSQWFAFSMPRGWGKTTLCEAAAEWAAITGRHPFVLLIRATAEFAAQSLANLKTHLISNDLLLEDYPEVVYPIRRLDGESRRCLGQRYNGERTLIAWTRNEIVLPTIPGSAASGTIFRVAGITGNIRGAKHDRPDGRTVRPSLAVVDDPQTDESAKSPLQVSERLKTLTKAIQRLGDGGKLSILIPCTVIEPNDMADQVLDRARFPEYRGERTRMLVDFPRDLALWHKYREMQTDTLATGGTIDAATAFYREHRAEMDAGATVAWPEKFDEPRELSAVQHAMNRFLADPRAFWCEDQNDPGKWQESQSGGYLEPADVVKRVCGIARGIVPLEAQHLTVGIDVHDDILYWLASAWGGNFSGWIVDYGAWPDQRRHQWPHEKIPVPLTHHYPGTGTEAAIRQGLLDLVAHLAERQWQSQAGIVWHPSQILCDIGYKPDQVCDVARTSPHAALVTPARGIGISAVRRPMAEYSRKPGDRMGWHWYLAPPTRGLRTLLSDTNHWKTFLAARWRTAIGDPGALALPGRDMREHEFLAAHVTSEIPTRVTANGRTIEQWAPRPGPDIAHWLDCLVMCAVAASFCGVTLPGAEAAKTEKKTVKLSDLQRRR